jgi:hypothetical protein
MGALLTSPTRILEAPSHRSTSSSTRRSLSAYIRGGGLSPTNVRARAPNHGAAQAAKSKTRTPVQERQYCSRGSKNVSYHAKEASSMPLLVPLNHSYPHL